MTPNTLMLYQTSRGPVVKRGADLFAIDHDWNDLVNIDALFEFLDDACQPLQADPSLSAAINPALAPIGKQEVWAAGVTYQRSRTARMQESREAGGGDFYERVYDAVRPEIFFKATPDRVVGDRQSMHLRSDSDWMVPEPELVLSLTRNGVINGYTIGNDLSCRDIEGENPLYLPQAKTFARCAAIGPGLLVTKQPIRTDTSIQLQIRRGDEILVDDGTSLSRMKRSFDELADFLFRDNQHQNGCLLMTGTGIVPDDTVTLLSGDVVDICIDGIGTLRNTMN